MMGLSGSVCRLSLEVELKNTVAEVKEKIQVLYDICVENQGLGFGWKRLNDDNTLEDYNIQEFSEIDLRKKIPSAGDNGTGKDTNKKVEWDEIAVVAFESFEKGLKEKNIQFNQLTQNKIAVENELKNDEKYLDYDLKKQFKIEREITTCKMGVEKKKVEIKELEETINKKLKEKEKLGESINQKRYRKEKKRKERSALNNSLEKLTNDLKNMCSKNAGNEKLLKENQKMTEEKSSLKVFLSKTIAEKEALLECPVCFNTASPPIYKCSKEHLICCNCLPKMNDKCPTCRTWILGPDKNFRLAEEIHKDLVKLREKIVEI